MTRVAATRGERDDGAAMTADLAKHYLYGLHRVVGEVGVLPQAAQRLDPSLTERSASELVIEVDMLNIDSASFRQIEEGCGHDETRIAAEIERIVRDRGKMHNPVTGSGG